ncbi:MAG: signal peptidase I [Roseburia sp.]|nr:signal peptidase I [Roseburia sp.]
MIPALCNLFGILILLAVIALCLPLTAPRLMGYEIYHVISGSMEPQIPVGSVIYVAAAAPEDVLENDVIAFWSNDSVVTHRVMSNRMVEGEFVTKGDANEAEDINTVPYENLIGQVKYHIPILGDLMVILTGTVGKIYLLGFAACGVMLNMLASRLRDRGGDEDDLFL